MASDKRQFDPVAAAATSALDATQRSARQVRAQVDAPQPPMESQAFRGVRSAVSTVSQFSPANVLAGGDLPSPPTPGSGGKSISPGGGGLPDSVQQFVPQNVMQNLPDPAGILSNEGSLNQRRPRNGSGRNNGKSSGSNGSSSGSSGSNAMTRRRSR